MCYLQHQRSQQLKKWCESYGRETLSDHLPWRLLCPGSVEEWHTLPRTSALWESTQVWNKHHQEHRHINMAPRMYDTAPTGGNPPARTTSGICSQANPPSDQWFPISTIKGPLGLSLKQFATSTCIYSLQSKVTVLLHADGEANQNEL